MSDSTLFYILYAILTGPKSFSWSCSPYNFTGRAFYETCLLDSSHRISPLFWGVPPFYRWVKWSSEATFYLSTANSWYRGGTGPATWLFWLPSDAAQKHCKQSGSLPGHRAPCWATILGSYHLEIRMCWKLWPCFVEGSRGGKEDSQVNFLCSRGGGGDSWGGKQPKKQ